MEKNFDAWNEDKKRIHERRSAVYAHTREIWWCALGVNVGAETDGKSDNFERPILVLRAYNKDTLLVLPITGKEKNDEFHCLINVPRGKAWVKLTQARVISSRRLLRKLGVLGEMEFVKVADAFRGHL